ncbi:MAG TPA: CoA transferase [Deltaproteobacteria bacterium]|jgi:crotonobetainyl-CoA:carnitine CoA-transferase CaiB-like acyl-CoA transferase|nr:CoA transferase [Deltaproteobacteria bacterium]HQJ09573.1 CoA transferase [Deltaproteobacteria bacterium]
MVLEGIRVIDITQFISGSRCTQILADMGAEVIKVEPPQGDTLRLIFSLMAGAERNYSVLNRNKYGVAIDWRKPEGQDIIRQLAGMSDIFVHNLIPGTLERSRLGYEDLKGINPDIIYAAISGFGSTGANPERAAFDIIAQATSGQLWNSLEDLAPPSNYWGDLVSGAYAAIACLLAVIHRMKTGHGQFIDISMQDVLYFNNYRAMMDKALSPIMDQVEKTLGRKPRDVMNSSDRMPFYGFFKATDGKVAIVALTARQWKDLSGIIGRPEMATDQKFNNIISQIHNHKEAVDLIEEWTCRHSSDEIIRVLESKKIPCGIAYSSEQVNADENLRQRGMFTKVTHEAFGEIDVPGVPFKFSDTPGSVRRPAPKLGEHNRIILEQRLGLSKDEIDHLYEKGVIA